jgi:carbohydrate-selective porin OprB
MHGDVLHNQTGHFFAFSFVISASIDTDLNKLLGWSGATAHTTFYQIGHANGLPAANFVGSIADPSNIEAMHSTRKERLLGLTALRFAGSLPTVDQNHLEHSLSHTR